MQQFDAALLSPDFILPVPILTLMSLELRQSCRKLFLVAVLAACSESTAPPRPASVTIDNTSVADGIAGTILTTPPAFVVKDGNGNSMGGVSITVAVTAGGGTVTGTPTQTASGGSTPVGQWTLGTIAGVNTITVTVDGLPPLVITVTGRAGPPASLAFVSGQEQSVLAGTIVNTAPVVQVRDQFNNGVPNVPVQFTIAEGDGAVSSSPVVTNASGNAAAPQWRVGRSAVTQILRATAGTLSTQTSAFINTAYDIDLRFVGPPMPAAATNAFTAAAARIRGSVIGDLSDVSAGAGTDLTDCGLPGVVISGIIDDLVIYASVLPIDGPGRILARAGPCFVRQTGRQTIIGVMQFDSDDTQTLIDQGRLRDVIQHEMLHVVGVGTLWGEFGVLAGAGTPEVRYTGALGVGGCIAIGGAAVCPGSVPVEATGGAGTADSHWRESVFGTELMTGFVGQSNPLSSMTIQSLGDVGYVTNPGGADSYTVPNPSSSALLHQLSEPPPVWEEMKMPVFTMRPDGRVERLRRQ